MMGTMPRMLVALTGSSLGPVGMPLGDGRWPTSSRHPVAVQHVFVELDSEAGTLRYGDHAVALDPEARVREVVSERRVPDAELEERCLGHRRQEVQGGGLEDPGLEGVRHA